MRLDQGFPGYYYSSFSLGVVWELGEELQHLTILENYDFSLTQEVILAPLNPQFQLERLDLKNISYFKNHPKLNKDIPSLHGCNIFPSQATYSTRSVTKNVKCLKLSTWVEAYWETTRVEYLVPDKKEKKDTLQQFF